MFKLNSHYTMSLLFMLITTLVGTTAPVYAENDDTEIYLNSPSSTGTANILLNLDTSGSMSSTVDEDNNGTLDSGERSRLEVMKEATIDLLDNMSALNVGLMRYHYYGGPILFPIANLNDSACEIEGSCTSSTPATGTATVSTLMSANSDDGEEATATPVVFLTNTTLTMGENPGGTSCTTTTITSTVSTDNDALEQKTWDPVGHSGGSDSSSSDMEIPDDGGAQQLNGLIFRNVDPTDVLDGKTITSAFITFTIDETTSDSDEAVDVNIYTVNPEDIDTDSNFTASNREPGDYYLGQGAKDPVLGTVVEWTIDATDDPGVGDPLVTDDIAPLVQAAIDHAGWDTSAKRNLLFLIENDAAAGKTGKRTVESRTAGVLPELTINYETCATTTTTDIDVGLRFQKVKIPQGQNITAARIDFTAAAAATGTPAFTIKIEDVDTAAAFDSTDTDNISSRTYDATTETWNNVSATNPITDWVVDTVYSTPDLSDLIKEVTNRAGWCGGNDLVITIDGGASQTKRTAYAQDNGDSAKSPKLYITYDNDARDAGASTGNPNACNVSTVTAKVESGSDDAEEHTDGSIDLTSSDLEMVQESDTQVIGLRFQDIPIAQGTTIVSAKLTFTADEAQSGATSLTIEGQDSDTASAFSTTTNNVTNTTSRPRTTASTTWTISTSEGWTVGTTYESDDITSIIQEIVNRGSWAAGNDLALFLSGSGKRTAFSFNGTPSKAVTLTMEIQGDATIIKETVRERLKSLVGNLTQRGGTPILGSILEAAYYFRGEDVRFGRQRGQQSSSDSVTSVSHAASYEANGATVTYPGNCTADNETDSDCKTQVISGGTPKYKSPIIAECQTNYLINLTDGGGYFTGGGKTNTLGQSIDEDDLTNAFVAEDSDGDSVSLTNCASNTTLSDGSTVYSGSTHNECAVKLTKFLHDNDQSYTSSQTLASGSAPIDGTQIIETHTIGFNLCGTGNVTSEDSSGEQVCCAVGNHTVATGLCSSPITDPDKIKVLKAMADVGGGDYFNANTSAELLAAFTEITANIVSRSTSFSSPSIAANAFNRLLSRDEVYFGLFEPNKQVNWPGNIKKYNLCTVTDIDGDGTDDCTLGDVLDANLVNAVVDDSSATDDGLFSTDSQSEWSATTDGREIKIGGAGGEITDYTDRKLYTDVNDAGDASNAELLSATGHELTSANWDDGDHDEWRDQVCPTPSTTAGSDCEKQMLFLLGKDIFDEDDDSGTDTRWWFHDVLHSSPIGITYGETSGGDFIDKIVLATNDGALHFINGTTGVEEWAFMPNALLANQNQIYEDTGTNHLYGLDSTPRVVVNDVDNDGTIEPADGDTVYVYVSQRRGGKNIYALDITPSATLTTTSGVVVPKFLFRIDGGSGDFARMGQSWSEPFYATIGSKSGSTTNIPEDVLIFAGGYDEDLDVLESSGAGPNKNFGLEGGTPNDGNAIYVVNPTTGALIFDISHAANAGLSIAASGADIEVPDMFYSIPSNLTVFDSDGDGLHDRIYVGDTAGQVWRVDFLGDIQTSGGSREGSTIVGKLADISTSGSATTERRFFYRPAVIQVADSTYSDAAGGEFDYIVMGTGNRANPLVTDTSDRLYAFRDTQIGVMQDTGTADNLADDYPQNIDLTASVGAAIANSDLTDVTSSGIDSNSSTDTSSLGWYFDFDTFVVSSSTTDGEKVLAAAGVFNNTVIFTTYIPDDASTVVDVCSASEGTGRAFNLNLLSAGAALDWDGDGDIDADDRVATLGSGIPSEAVPIFTKEGVTLLVGTGGGAENLGQVSGVPRVRTYWYEES